MPKGQHRKPVSSDLLDIAHGLNVTMAKLQDQYILMFFGSQEEVERLAPYFELEYHPMELCFEKDGDKMSFQIENHIRIKMKDNITDILVKET